MYTVNIIIREKNEWTRITCMVQINFINIILRQKKSLAEYIVRCGTYKV